MNSFKQRSSIPSSVLTALIGWIGFIFIGPLLFGFKAPSDVLFILGLASAIVQVVILRIGFFILQMHKHLAIGAFWGLATAIGIYFTTLLFYPEQEANQLYWLIIYALIGAPVGGFISYFYIDDQEIFDAADSEEVDTNFGRDAHWLEPFAYGVLAYLLIFFPFTNLDLFINVFLVGTISGILAAGASHYSSDELKKSFVKMAFIIVVIGGIQGLVSGFLFRSYTDILHSNNFVLGIVAGILTYLITFLRGRQLASKEEKGEL